jgi:hypothetical protein
MSNSIPLNTQNTVVVAPTNVSLRGLTDTSTAQPNISAVYAQMDYTQFAVNPDGTVLGTVRANTLPPTISAPAASDLAWVAPNGVTLAQAIEALYAYADYQFALVTGD